MVVSGSQLYSQQRDSPVFSSWLSESSCNIIISQVLLVRLLWKKRPPLVLCSLLEEWALHSLPQPGTAGSAVFPLTLSKHLLCQAPNPHLTPNLPPISLPSMSSCPHGAPEVGEGSRSHHSHSELTIVWQAPLGRNQKTVASCGRAQPGSHVDQEMSVSRRFHNHLL